MPLIHCEVNLILTLSEDCVLTDTATRDADPNTDPPVTAINAPWYVANFKITNTKLYAQ